VIGRREEVSRRDAESAEKDSKQGMQKERTGKATLLFFLALLLVFSALSASLHETSSSMYRPRGTRENVKFVTDAQESLTSRPRLFILCGLD
jgi:hypothetical protein